MLYLCSRADGQTRRYLKIDHGKFVAIRPKATVSIRCAHSSDRDGRVAVNAGHVFKFSFAISQVVLDNAESVDPKILDS